MAKHLLLPALVAALLPLALVPAWAAVASAPGPNVATVNGTPVTRAALIERALYETTAGADLLNEMVNELLVEQEAKAKSITVTKAETDARIKTIRDATPGEQFQLYLRMQSLTEKGLPGKVRIKLLVEKLLANQIQVSETEARAYYDQNKDQLFNVPETVSLSVIKSATEAAAKAAAERIAKGADFAQVAAEVSTDENTKAKSGRVPGALAKVQLPPGVAEAAFSTEVGKVSAPVQSQDGWWLVKVESKAAAITRPFEQVKERIISELRTEKLRQAWEKWLTAKRKSAEIKSEL